MVNLFHAGFTAERGGVWVTLSSVKIPFDVCFLYGGIFA
jgi:hypothetical protein